MEEHQNEEEERQIQNHFSLTNQAHVIAQNLKLPENAEVICANDEIYIRVKMPDGEQKIFKANKT